jgi:hypothetical protein
MSTLCVRDILKERMGRCYKSDTEGCLHTSGRIHDDFSRLQFLHAHSEASALTNELC